MMSLLIPEINLFADWTLLLIWFVVLWELVWKGIALWKAGRNNQLVWFLLIFLFNTLGILPIIYLLFFQKNQDFKTRKSKHTR